MFGCSFPCPSWTAPSTRTGLQCALLTAECPTFLDEFSLFVFLSPMSHKMVHQKFIGSFHRPRVGSGDSWIIPDTAVLCFSLFQNEGSPMLVYYGFPSQDPEPFLSTNKFDLVIRRVWSHWSASNSYIFYEKFFAPSYVQVNLRCAMLVFSGACSRCLGPDRSSESS